jgi:hypothetical protein
MDIATYNMAQQRAEEVLIGAIATTTERMAAAQVIATVWLTKATNDVEQQLNDLRTEISQQADDRLAVLDRIAVPKETAPEEIMLNLDRLHNDLQQLAGSVQSIAVRPIQH